MISSGFVSVTLQGNDQLLAVVVGSLGNVQDDLVPAVGGAAELGSIDLAALGILCHLELAQAQGALGGIRGGSSGICVQDFQFYRLGHKLKHHIIGGHGEGESAGGIGSNLQLGVGVALLVDHHAQVVVVQFLVVIVVPRHIQRSQLQGVNHHDTVLPGLGQALGGGAGHAADLVAVLVLGLTGGAGGSFLLDAVQQGQELGINVHLLVCEGIRTVSRALHGLSGSRPVQQAVFAGGLLVASGIGVNHLLAADRLGSLPCRRSGHIGKPDLADVIAVPGVELKGDLLGLAGSGVGVSFVRRAAILHLGVDHSEVGVGGVVAVLV